MTHVPFVVTWQYWLPVSTVQNCEDGAGGKGAGGGGDGDGGCDGGIGGGDEIGGVGVDALEQRETHARAECRLHLGRVERIRYELEDILFLLGVSLLKVIKLGRKIRNQIV